MQASMHAMGCRGRFGILHTVYHAGSGETWDASQGTAADRGEYPEKPGRKHVLCGILCTIGVLARAWL